MVWGILLILYCDIFAVIGIRDIGLVENEMTQSYVIDKFATIVNKTVKRRRRSLHCLSYIFYSEWPWGILGKPRTRENTIGVNLLSIDLLELKVRRVRVIN